MKRRLLSAFLAVMMVLTMAPVAFAAEEAGNGNALKKLFTDVKAGESGSGNVTVTIDKDYDLTGYNWTALPVDGYNGAGIVTVEGNNHTITGLNTSLFAGGFAGTSGIVIKDLTLDNVSIEDTTNKQGIGAFINNVDAMPKIELNNCHLTDSTITSTGGARVGGLIGWTSGYNKKNDGPVDTYITVTNCSVENTKITAAGSVGGIIGHAGANPATFHTFNNNTITNCTLNSTDSGDWRVGVVVGTANVGEVALNNTTKSGNTVTQTGKTAPAGQSNLYGRFVPGTTGKLVIDGTAVFDSSIVAVVDNKGYKTLADAVAAAQSGATVKLLKDVTEDVVIPAGKTVTLDLNGKNIKPATGDAIVNKGNLTIVGSGEVAAQKSGSAAIANFPDATANVNGGTFVSAYWYVIKNLGNMTIDGPVTIKKPEGNTDTSSLIDNGWYGSTDKVAGESVSAQADKAKLTIKSGEFTGKSGSASCSVIKNDDYATLDISGGTFDSTNNQNTSNATTILNWNVATISGGTFIGQYPLANGAYNNAADKGQFTISGGTFTGLKSVFGYGQGGDGVGKITITDGNFAAPAFGDWGSAYTMEISGGYFTVDPSAYCVTGKTGVASDKDGYKYKVGTVEVKDENKITTDTQKGATKANLGSAIADTDKTNATDVGKSVTPTKLADTTPITADDKAQALTELVKNKKVTLNQDGTIPQDTTVTVVKETYLDVTVTAYDTTSNTVSMNIAPKYNLIAVAKTGTNEEKVTLESAQDAKVGSTEVTVILPEAFKGQKVYINHNNGANLYVATADESGKITFTTNGFSPFTFALTNPDVVAEVNGNAYKSLQDAANAAKDGGEITVVQNKNLDLTFNTTKSVKVTNKTDDKITVKFNGTNKDVAKNATETFSYTKPSSGSSSGGSSSGKTTYKVTTSAVNNGGVNASPSNAEKGATITITLSPDKGYKLDKLTVTDGSGKSVSTVKKSDTVYTFTMPASAVKVGVSYVKATETPSETKFNDVSANDWFASAVDYVTGKGMMNGTAANTFSPKANTTRGMLMTVLARHAGEDTTGGSVWYEKGMNWAKANGVSDGTNPQVNITREQLAAMLYRYAQNKKYDVSGAKSLDGYTDAQSVSSYAVPALQWANAAGVVTGKSGSKLDPKGYATRAEVAAMLMRFCENVEK